MQITIHLGEPAWRLVKQKKILVCLDGETRTVADVIAELGKQFAGLGAELRGQTGDFVPYALFLNDAQVRWAEIENTRVKEGDSVRVLLPIAGG
jgi:molybdopterin converting factor small subunit